MGNISNNIIKRYPSGLQFILLPTQKLYERLQTLATFYRKILLDMAPMPASLYKYM